MARKTQIRVRPQTTDAVTISATVMGSISNVSVSMNGPHGLKFGEARNSSFMVSASEATGRLVTDKEGNGEKKGVAIFNQRLMGVDLRRSK
jgi:hypothetical protein